MRRAPRIVTGPCPRYAAHPWLSTYIQSGSSAHSFMRRLVVERLGGRMAVVRVERPAQPTLVAVREFSSSGSCALSVAAVWSPISTGSAAYRAIYRTISAVRAAYRPQSAVKPASCTGRWHAGPPDRGRGSVATVSAQKLPLRQMWSPRRVMLCSDALPFRSFRGFLRPMLALIRLAV